jgi:hypothetical protein
MKTMRFIIPLLIIGLFIAGSMPVMAQDEKESEEVKKFKHRAEQFEKMRSMKIAFISEELALTPEEAEKFWPVYNEMESKREAITHDLMREFFKPGERPEEISNEQAEELMQSRFKQEQMLLNLKMEYHKEYLKILSPARVLKLYESENKFRRGLMERLDRGRDGERKPQGRGAAKPHRGNRSFRR